MGLSRTVSTINGDFSRKSQIFLTQCILRPRWRSSLGFGCQRWDQKTRMMGYRAEQVHDIFSRVDTMHQRDKDGQTEA